MFLSHLHRCETFIYYEGQHSIVGTQRESIARISLSMPMHLRRCKMPTALVVGQSDDEYPSRCSACWVSSLHRTGCATDIAYAFVG